MLNEFPHAIAMQHANQPDETIFQAEAQCIRIITNPYSAVVFHAFKKCRYTYSQFQSQCATLKEMVGENSRAICPKGSIMFGFIFV